MQNVADFIQSSLPEVLMRVELERKMTFQLVKTESNSTLYLSLVHPISACLWRKLLRKEKKQKEETGKVFNYMINSC